MFKFDDAYSYLSFLPLKRPDGTPAGLLALEYRVKIYNDVQVQNASSVTDNNRNQQFIVQCTQRLMLDSSDISVQPTQADAASLESFVNYPALLTANMLLKTSENQELQLLEYSPLTVNTAVSQSQSTGSSSATTSETSTSSTTGSSLQQSSTYGVSVTLGDTFSGITGSYEHSQSTESSKSKSIGNSGSRSGAADTSLGSSMSIKDWGTYASVDSSTVCPSWVFGQEYPWNAIESKFYANNSYNGDGQQYQLYISAAMQANLYDKVFLYPPSELSMFGVNFVMKSSWRMIIEDTASTDITFAHQINYYLATHIIENNQANVYMDVDPSLLITAQTGLSDNTATITLDANLMALDPVGYNISAAIVGFMPNKFIPQLANVDGTSTAVPKGFKIIAATNDLMILDTTTYPSADAASGFTAAQTALTATWNSTQKFPYTLTLYFKITDSVSEYNLYLKHWKTQATAVRIDIVVNNLTGSPITKYVDAFEGEGGENNLHVIALRDLDFTSVSYHDYLQLGLNSITLTLSPIDGDYSSVCGYQVRAISVEKQ